jgi:Common central domain of tyrosinase
MICILNFRKNVKDLTDGEKQNYVQAVLKLKDPNISPSLIPAAQIDGAKSRYDDFVWLHLLAMHGAHQGPAFTPWHRVYLKVFEQELIKVSGDPNLSIPYWDYTTARSESDKGWPFTENFMGGNGIPTDQQFPHGVENGPFAPRYGKWIINVTTGVPRDRPNEGPWDDTNYLRREFRASSELPNKEQVKTALFIPNYDSSSWTEDPRDAQALRTYIRNHFRANLEYPIHNTVHRWVGGNMLAMTSPNDPIFFLHHCNIDRLWAVWQEKYHGETYQPYSGGRLGHNLADYMVGFGNSSNTHHDHDDHGDENRTINNFSENTRPMDTLDHHAMGIWYDTDLPDISLHSSILSCGNIELNSSLAKAVEFQVKTPREIVFRISKQPQGNFQSYSNEPIVLRGHDTEFASVKIWILYRSPSEISPTEVSTCTIQAHITDIEGHYANDAGGQFVILDQEIKLTATPVNKYQDETTRQLPANVVQKVKKGLTRSLEIEGIM